MKRVLVLCLQVDVFNTEAFAQDNPPLVGSNPHFQLYGFDFVVSETGGQGTGQPTKSSVWLMEVRRITCVPNSPKEVGHV